MGRRRGRCSAGRIIGGGSTGGVMGAWSFTTSRSVNAMAVVEVNITTGVDTSGSSMTIAHCKLTEGTWAKSKNSTGVRSPGGACAEQTKTDGDVVLTSGKPEPSHSCVNSGKSLMSSSNGQHLQHIWLSELSTDISMFSRNACNTFPGVQLG